MAPRFGRLWLLCAFAVAGVWAGSARGQLAPASASEFELLEPQRDRLYQELASDVQAMERELGLVKRVVRLVTPTVVHIEARPLRDYRVRGDLQEAGSGVIARIAGADYVVTNRHVVKNSSEEFIRIQLADGRVLQPRRIVSDAMTDVAVLSVDSTGLTPARLGDSDQVEIGDFALAVGSPFGLSQSVTRGIISAKGRYNLDLGDGEVKYQNFLQTDAAINPGNSGGPLFNVAGEVVGISTAIYSPSGASAGIGFATPSDLARPVIEQLRRDGRVERGWLGVAVQDAASTRGGRGGELRGGEAPVQRGVLIAGVERNSPAARAGLRQGDVVTAINGERIETSRALVRNVAAVPPGQTVTLGVLRDGRERELPVQVGRRPPGGTER